MPFIKHPMPMVTMMGDDPVPPPPQPAPFVWIQYYWKMILAAVVGIIVLCIVVSCMWKGKEGYRAMARSGPERTFYL